MNRKRENGMMLIAAIVWLSVTALVVMCCSCSGKKVVTELVEVHDTLVVHHSDTIRMETVRTKTDTLREVTIKEITLLRDTAGKTDTIRIATTNDHYRYIYEGDSSSVYRAAVDSILKALDRQKDKQTVKTKPLVPWWQYALFLGILTGACIIILKSRIF